MNYTATGVPEAETRVSQDLDRLVSAIRHEAANDRLVSVFLIGSFAKEEGAVVQGPGGRLHGFNDYDLLLLFAEPPARPEGYAALARTLARELGIDFVDLGLATRAQIAMAPPTLFWFEVGEAHRVLWRAPGTADALPRFEAGGLDPAEGSRLLVNRGMSLLWAARRLWPDRDLVAPPRMSDPAHVRFAAIACHKAVAAAGDAVLLRSGRYQVRQAARLGVLEQHPEFLDWAGPGFVDAYRAAWDFRRNPVILGKELGALWSTARSHHEAGFRAAERFRLGRDTTEWKDHARAVASRVRLDRIKHPRQLVSWVRRGLSPETWMTGEEIRFRCLPRLLYHASPECGEWRTQADRLIGEWHD
jgi:hypothetical protein